MNNLDQDTNVRQDYKMKHFSILVLAICLLFYLFFAFYDGAVIFPDSYTYINMTIYREPFYPIFLEFCRQVFQNFGVDYLFMAVLVQSILTAVSSWSLVMYITRKFHLHYLISVFFLCILMSTSFVWSFVEQQGGIYSNSILSEGIVIPCYFLFFRFLLEYMDHRSKKNLFICCLLVFVLLSTRKQMVVSLFMLGICILMVFFRDKEYRKGLVIALSCMLGILFANIILDCGYNYAVRGFFSRHSGDTRFITTMVFYTADKTDLQMIKDEETKRIFLDIYETCNGKNLLKKSAGDGWVNRISHFIDSYDDIQLHTMQPMINKYINEDKLGYGDDGLHKRADAIMNSVNHILLPHNFGKIVGTIMDNFVLGLIMTVSHRRYSILRWYSLFAYIGYILLLLYHARRKESQDIFLFAVLVLLSILINVGLVSMVIFCQTRYMIYNMALFYISIGLMARPVLVKILNRD